jgi:ABC-2 type transport system ATP-binding protein
VGSVTPAAVELHNAAKTYGTVQALKGINFAVQPGETVALLGPNGAGKTTAISLMLGLRAPTTGRAALFGRDPRDPASRTRIGVMLQESGVPDTLKVREVAELFRRLYPRPMDVVAALHLFDDPSGALLVRCLDRRRARAGLE